MNKFLHSGKYGDLLYAMPAIKALGGGEIFFNLTEGSLCTEQSFNFCKPLLEAQPYISAVKTIILRDELKNTRGEKMFCRQDVEHPDLLILDAAWYWRIYPETRHWIYRYAYTFGVTVDASLPVLEVPIHKMDWTKRPIIVNLTPTFRTKEDSFYEKLLKRPDVIRIGDRSDIEVPCKNMFQMANLIANSKFFVGNFSCPNAVAQGLQHPRLIEVEPQYNDAYPIGPDGHQNTDNLDADLEKMTAISKDFWQNKN